MITGLYIPELCESLDDSRGTIRNEVRLPQRTNDFLPRQSAVGQAPTEESDTGVSIVTHELRSQLSAIIAISDAIFNITDLMPEEFYEYLQQIRSNAYKMDEIINHPLFHSEVRKADMP